MKKALVILLFVHLGCAGNKTTNETNFKHPTPPGTVEIAPNLYCDQFEISNIDWKEYVYWVKRVFGDSTPEYFASLPDTTVWEKLDSCYHIYKQVYFSHPSYNSYPVVGVSHQQSLEYSIWRSDRVFEQLLIRQNKISLDQNLDPKTYFTIDRYYNRTLKTIIDPELYLFYPNYELPSREDRASILISVDSLNFSKLEKCKTKKCRDQFVNYPKMQSDIDSCSSAIPMISTGDVQSNLFPIYNLRGNVSEMLSQPDLQCGGSWNSKRGDVIKNDLQNNLMPSATIGFRNICRWQQWRK